MYFLQKKRLEAYAPSQFFGLNYYAAQLPLKGYVPNNVPMK